MLLFGRWEGHPAHEKTCATYLQRFSLRTSEGRKPRRNWLTHVQVENDQSSGLDDGVGGHDILQCYTGDRRVIIAVDDMLDQRVWNSTLRCGIPHCDVEFDIAIAVILCCRRSCIATATDQEGPYSR